MPGGIGLDLVIDAGIAQRLFEPCLHVIREGTVFDRTGHIDFRAHTQCEQVWARRRIVRKPAAHAIAD